MAVQGEWEQGGLGLCFNVKSMAQAKITVQGTPKQVDHLPQPNPESVMGAGAAARKHPQQQAPLPVPSKTAHHNGGSIQLSPLEMKQIMEMITQMRDEMRAWGKETRTAGEKMATPHCGDSEATRGSATAVRSAIETGEVVINGETETCKTRHEVTTSEKELNKTKEVTELRDTKGDDEGNRGIARDTGDIPSRD